VGHCDPNTPLSHGAGLTCVRRVSLLGGLGAKLIAVENGAAFLRRELRLYVTKPTHPQSSNVIYDLADLFSCVFWQIHGGFQLIR
jgi:hypothetical protein